MTNLQSEKPTMIETSDEAMLIGRPSYREIAAAVARLIGSPPEIVVGWCAPYRPQSKFTLKFIIAGRDEPAEIHVHEDTWPERDTPWFGMSSTVTTERNDYLFGIIEGLTDAFGGWTRRPDRRRETSGWIVTPQTAEWSFHAGPTGHDPALDAEIALTNLGLGGSDISQPLCGVLADRRTLDSVIGILSAYRDATKDGVTRIPGSDQRTRHDEMVERQLRRGRKRGG